MRHNARDGYPSPRTRLSTDGGGGQRCIIRWHGVWSCRAAASTLDCDFQHIVALRQCTVVPLQYLFIPEMFIYAPVSNGRLCVTSVSGTNSPAGHTILHMYHYILRDGRFTRLLSCQPKNKRHFPLTSGFPKVRQVNLGTTVCDLLLACYPHLLIVRREVGHGGQ